MICVACGSNCCPCPTFCELCRRADAKRPCPDADTLRLRRLLEPGITLDRAYAELNGARRGLPASTIAALDYLLRQGDPAQLRAWVLAHSPQERRLIAAHIKGKCSEQAA
jgi:hypothetical protein